MKEKVLLLSMWYPSHQGDRQRTWAIADIVAEMRRFSVETVVVVAREENRKVTADTVNGQTVISVPPTLITRSFLGRREGGRWAIRGRAQRSVAAGAPPASTEAIDAEAPDSASVAIPFWRRSLRATRNRLVQLRRRLRSGMNQVLCPLLRPIHYRQLRRALAPFGDFDRVVIHGRIARHMHLVRRFWSGPVSVCFHETDYHEPSREEVFRKWGGQIRQVAFRSEQLHGKFVEAGLIDPALPYFVVASGVPEKSILARAQYKPKEPGLLKLVCVSSMIARKNLGPLIQTLSQLRSLAWSLDLYGRGPLQANLEALVERLGLQERVRFRGFVSHEEIMRGYSRYDVFVLLSERETFGMVYTEALSQGLYVIGSDGEGIDGIIQDGVNGFLVPPQQPGVLLQKLELINGFDERAEARFKDQIYGSIRALTLERIAADYYDRMVKREGSTRN